MKERFLVFLSFVSAALPGIASAHEVYVLDNAEVVADTTNPSFDLNRLMRAF